MSPSRFFLLIAPILFVAGGMSQAAVTLAASADNNTWKGSADAVTSPDGLTLALKEATSAQPNARIAYVKFDTTGVTSAEHGTTAAFSLATSTTAGTTFSISVFALNPGITGYDWAENTITWNNSPALGGSADNYVDPAKATLAGTTSVANGSGAGTAITVNLTNWQNYVQADQSITFVVVVTAQSSGTPTLALHSSESASSSLRPALSIIPEPGSIALVSFAALGLFRRRR